MDGLFKGWQAYQCVRFRREELLEAFVVHLRRYFTVKEMAYLGPGCKDKEAKI